MIQMLVVSLATVAAVAFIPATGAQSAEQQAKPQTQTFLKKAAEMQQAEITLGRLAADRGANKRVRQFGLQMTGAHNKINEEVLELAAAKGVQLPTELSDEHKQKVNELSQLSGHAFDREYMHYILRDKQNVVSEFEEGMLTVEDSDVLHWTYRSLPMLRMHVEEARGIKQGLQTNP
ncbi:MAG: DUF4142 domain-containing protein [Nitrospira sp.]